LNFLLLIQQAFRLAFGPLLLQHKPLAVEDEGGGSRFADLSTLDALVFCFLVADLGGVGKSGVGKSGVGKSGVGKSGVGMYVGGRLGGSATRISGIDFGNYGMRC